jgi:hypothetical protein
MGFTLSENSERQQEQSSRWQIPCLIKTVKSKLVMMRKARVDANQAEIVQALRLAGCTIQHLHTVGHGCPDLLVGIAGVNYLLEVKDGQKPPSKRKLTPDEIAWHEQWSGQVAIVYNVDEALAIVLAKEAESGMV